MILDADDNTYEEQEKVIAGNTAVSGDVGGDAKDADLEISDHEAPDLEEAKANIRA